jgi:hypothetical protein
MENGSDRDELKMPKLKQIVDLNVSSMPQIMTDLNLLDKFGTRVSVTEYVKLDSWLVVRKSFVCQKPFCKVEMN